MVFWSFLGMGVLWFFSMFWGYVGQFLGFGGYFGHFLGFGVYQSFFRYRNFLCLRGHFGHFLHFMGVFWSYSSNRGYFDLFQALGGGVLSSFSMF